MSSYSLPGTGTCLSFSATAPASDDIAGYDAVDWTPAVQLRVSGDLSATRALNSNTNLCTGEVDKVLGAIDEGSQQVELAFKFDDPGETILHDAFRANTPVWVRRVMSNGHTTYFKAVVSQEGDTTPDGNEVRWKGQLEITGARLDKSA